MAVKKALTLDDEQLDELLREIASTAPHPEVERVAFLCSFKAGFRVQEIAGLRWDRHVMGPSGDFRAEVKQVPGARGRVKREKRYQIFIGDDIVKGGSSQTYCCARTVAMHPILEQALRDLRALGYDTPFVIPSLRANSSQSLKSRAHALRMRISRIYDKLEYAGCSSHSGRRTYITKSARLITNFGGSLADVQKAAGHAKLTTTQGYIDVADAQYEMIKYI